MTKLKLCTDTEKCNLGGRKPCPFCGSTNNIIMQSWFDEYKVLCLMCSCTSGASKTQDGAIARWNRRPIIIETENEYDD